MRRLVILVRNQNELESLLFFLKERGHFFEIEGIFPNQKEKKIIVLLKLTNERIFVPPFYHPLFEEAFFYNDSIEGVKNELESFCSIKKRSESIRDNTLSELKQRQQRDLLLLSALKSVSSDLERKLMKDGILLRGKYLSFALFDFDKEEEKLDYSDWERGGEAIQTGLTRIFYETPYFYFEFQNLFAAIFALSSPLEETSWKQKLSSVLNYVKERTSLSFSCSLSATFFFLDEELCVKRLYEQAKSCLECRWIMGEGLVLLYEELKDRGNRIPKIEESNFKKIGHALYRGKKRETISLVNEALKKAKGSKDKGDFLLSLHHLLNHLLGHCVSLNALYEIYDSHFTLIGSLLSKKSRKSVYAFFRKLVIDIIEINRRIRFLETDHAFECMIRIIEEEFSDSSFSIKRLSENTGYSASYIYATFKKHGTTFVKTVRKYRMEEAERLLLHSSSRIVQIALMVGYDDPYYFSSCFKKYFGHPPASHRKL